MNVTDVQGNNAHAIAKHDYRIPGTLTVLGDFKDFGSATADNFPQRAINRPLRANVNTDVDVFLHARQARAAGKLLPLVQKPSAGSNKRVTT